MTAWKLRTPGSIAHLLAILLVCGWVLLRFQREPTESDPFTARGIAHVDLAMVEFLLLLPFAALVVCFIRNVVGLRTFGTFAPALLGLAFRDIASWFGIAILLAIVLVGGTFRRFVNFLRLLQVPRSAFMLSLVVCLLLGSILLSNACGISLASALPLLPMVILTGTIERVWNMEEEEGPTAAFWTLLHTLGVASLIWCTIRIPGLRREFLAHPEDLGLVMAGQLWIGRYLGYRWLELYRFRSLAHHEEWTAPN